MSFPDLFLEQSSLSIGNHYFVFLVFGIVLAMFPDGGPNPTPQSMNYTVVINMAVWGGAMLYYFVDARKWFTGPKITIDVEGLTEEQQAALAAEGLDLGVGEGIAPGGGLAEPGIEGVSEKVGEKGDMDSS